MDKIHKISTAQLEFLQDEFLTLTLFGALGRSNTFSKTASENDRRQLRQELRKKLRELEVGYKTRIAEGTHIENIQKLSNELSSKYAVILRKDFRIGIAQKCLNLYLKYLWCMGEIQMPPHCPFDSIVIGQLPPADRVNFTQLETIDAYKKLVAAATKCANGRPLAEWELEVFNRRWKQAARREKTQGLLALRGRLPLSVNIRRSRERT